MRRCSRRSPAHPGRAGLERCPSPPAAGRWAWVPAECGLGEGHLLPPSPRWCLNLWSTANTGTPAAIALAFGDRFLPQPAASRPFHGDSSDNGEPGKAACRWPQPNPTAGPWQRCLRGGSRPKNSSISSHRNWWGGLSRKRPSASVEVKGKQERFAESCENPSSRQLGLPELCLAQEHKGAKRCVCGVCMCA